MLFNQTAPSFKVESLPLYKSFIRCEDDLPDYETVLSSIDYDMPFVESDRYNMAVLVSETSTILVLLDNDNKYKVYTKAVRAIEDYGLTLTDIYLCGSHIINFLYKNIYKKVEKTNSNTNLESFNEIIFDAISKNASEINIYALPATYARITFTIDDLVIAYKNFEFEPFLSLVKAFYSSIKKANKDEPNFNINRESNASIDHHVIVNGATRKFKVRWFSTPSHSGGYDITIRVNPINSSVQDLRSLGYDEKAIHAFDRLSRHDEGIIFIAGSTGSGKTTLAAAIGNRYMSNHHMRKKFLTVEDPVEIEIPNTHPTSIYQTQTQQGVSADELWDKASSAMMRRAPHAIMIGEVRNSSVASSVIRFSLSGHLTMTTIHASNPFQTLRLLQTRYQVDISTLMMPGVLRAIVSQKLVQLLCPECKLTFDEFQSSMPEYIVGDLKQAYGDALDQLYFENTDSSCSHCNGVGVKGRAPIYEIFLPDDNLRSMINKGDLFEAEKYWKSLDSMDGVSGISFKDRALMLVKDQKLCAFYAITKLF